MPIDEQTWEFINAVEGFYPADAAEFTVSEQREFYDKLCAHFRKPRPDVVLVKDQNIETGTVSIPVRLYSHKEREASAFALYFHGGGFVVGGLESHDDVCAEICARTGNDVLAVDYRLAPEHLHPSAFDDCLAAFNWVTSQTELPIILSGDSAGGNLAAAVSHHLKGRADQAQRQVLIYPALQEPNDQGSYETYANAPLLTTQDMEYYHKLRLRPNEDETATAINPLNDRDYTGLPETYLFAAGCDPLSDDAVIYHKRVLAAGVNSTLYFEEGLVHGYLRARNSVAKAQASFDRIVACFDL